MRFSLVMTTAGRTREPEDFLRSLHAQNYRDFELVVVDQNPDERLVPLLKAYREKFTLLHMRETRAGAAKGRNVGMSHASGDIIAFPDDDCLYPPGLLNEVAKTFADHPELDGLAGRSLGKDGHLYGVRFDSRPGFIKKANVWSRAVEYTMFLRKRSVEGVWFDESLGPGAGTMWGAGEGTEYLLQLLQRKAVLFYDPRLVVTHPSPVPPYDDTAARKAFSYGCGMGWVLRKHGYPVHLRVWWLFRPLGGATLSLLSLRLAKAKYHYSKFRGRLKGMIS